MQQNIFTQIYDYLIDVKYSVGILVEPKDLDIEVVIPGLYFYISIW